MTAVLLAAFLGVAQQSASTPLLEIVSVQVLPDDGAPRRCSVVLRNHHSASAVAWILEQRSRQSTVMHGAGWDSLGVESRQIGAQRQLEVETSCQDPARTFEVAAVLYADGSYAGNADRLNSNVLQRRRQKAAGLRELVTLLTNAQERPRNEGTPVEQLHDFVDSAPASIDRFAKSFVKMELGNLTRHDTEVASNYPVLKAALLKELAAEIEALEAVALLR